MRPRDLEPWGIRYAVYDTVNDYSSVAETVQTPVESHKIYIDVLFFYSGNSAQGKSSDTCRLRKMK